MAKKNFIDGLDSIFGADPKDGDGGFSLVSKEKKGDKGDKAKSKRKAKGSKDFTADLDVLLEEALQESVEQHAAKRKKSKSKPQPLAKSKGKQLGKGRIRRTLSGLDALIRQTVETSQMDIEDEPSDGKPKKKRMTFAFDKDKVDKLKSIARLEKAYIKDIVDDIVSEYIEDYQRRKGDV